MFINNIKINYEIYKIVTFSLIFKDPLASSILSARTVQLSLSSGGNNESVSNFNFAVSSQSRLLFITYRAITLIIRFTGCSLK